MSNDFYKKIIKWLCLLVFLTILDIGTKSWIRSVFFIGEKISIIPGINFFYLHNSGLAFGLFSNIKVFYWWILIHIILLIILIFFIGLYQAIQSNIRYNSISYVMIISGGLGNIYDRILYGTVIDFIDLYIGTWHWPIFNIADIEIFIGVLLLIIRSIIFDKKKYIQ